MFVGHFLQICLEILLKIGLVLYWKGFPLLTPPLETSLKDIELRLGVTGDFLLISFALGAQTAVSLLNAGAALCQCMLLGRKRRMSACLSRRLKRLFGCVLVLCSVRFSLQSDEFTQSQFTAFLSPVRFAFLSLVVTLQMPASSFKSCVLHCV